MVGSQNTSIEVLQPSEAGNIYHKFDEHGTEESPSCRLLRGRFQAKNYLRQGAGNEEHKHTEKQK